MASRTDFDRILIDWADELIQDLVASFSARRPTMSLRLAVAGLYLFAAVHLVWALMLPFFRNAVAGIVGLGSANISETQLMALATAIIIGGISYHLLLTVAYILLSFVVRASRHWTRAVGTIVLLANFIVSLNGLRAPTVSDVVLGLQWLSLILAGTCIALLWRTSVNESASFSSAQRRSLSADARD